MTASTEMSLGQVRASMLAHGAKRLLVKYLSPNDNSKNQIYLGGDLGVMNVIPAGNPVASSSGKHNTPIFKAPLTLSWIDDTGRALPAPNSQLILYPQYPEVRLSGFLKGARWSPNDLLRSRDVGRVLLLGISSNGAVFGYVAGPESRIANELLAQPAAESVGVFWEYSLSAATQVQNSRARLLDEFCRVSRRGWIPGWRLAKDGGRIPCTAPNCVGVTLESELGITANGRSDPDFDGWEVKCHTVPNLQKHGSGAITLLTPEPTGGFYVTHGVEEFVARFGYRDTKGRDDRWNFNGLHRVGQLTESTGLTLELSGYDRSTRKITRSDGELALIDSVGAVAASWDFARLLEHWKRKHSKAAFVPALKRIEPEVAFKYGSEVLLAEGTDYLRFLASLADGTVYYDPGIKVENVSTKPKAKKRSQFRVSRKNIAKLYHSCAPFDACDVV